MSATVRFSAVFVCDACKASREASMFESNLHDGMACPVPSLPEGWVERRFLAWRHHFCSAACERAALAEMAASQETP